MNSNRLTHILTAKQHAAEVADALLLAAYSEGISRGFHEDQAFNHLVKLIDTLGWKLPAPEQREKDKANG
ncbi:hypothetical protein J2W42_002245 [Rhizobium tibeticum]|uniref:hypothetical protein n=1 Tax=Rhizobium tibeticum TaxID=501024 RepID=UPI0027826435|nr:hypothetical protein [Rhizobium tibeticum]MDP9809397.1 hypothetical protein [Rhizobium tibeticum]